ncbi:hypothetical protein [Actinomadura macra]|uniref:hypothetical protein n=1 Tax=Actinomadura macra TaxID=46164 RepID=UPI000A8C3A71|nr:hypothetical protein [Actinomadura macra]
MSAESARSGARLRAERKKRGLVVADLARLFREVAPERVAAGLPSRRNIERLIRGHEAGEHAAGPRYRLLYSAALEIPEEELFPDPPQVPAAVPKSTVERPVTTPKDWDDMERRALLQLLAVLGSGASVSAAHLETLRSGLDRALNLRDDVTGEDWEQAVADHAYSIRVMSPAALVGVLSADIADLRHMIDRRPDLDRTSMQRTSAQLAALMAMALEELGDPLGSRWWRTAHSAAASAGDRHLEVYTRGRQARVSSTRPGALRLANQAVELAGKRPSAGLAEAHATRAVILARTGDRSGAEQALRDLDDLYAQLPVEVTGDDAAVWGWPRQRYVSERTNARLLLGDSSLYDELPKRPKSAIGARGQALGELKTAWARINAGSVSEGANDAAQAVAVLPPEHRTVTVKILAGAVCRSLPDEQARTLPAARELRALATAT